MEDGEDPGTRDWVTRQNQRTRVFLDNLPDRPLIREKLDALLRVTVVGAPRLAAHRLFALERGGDREQAVLTVRSAVDRAAPVRALVDPVARGGDTTAAIDWYHPSTDGHLLAYGTSEAGDERSTLRVLNVDSGAHLDDVIPDCRAASVAWLPDNTAFAYTRYPPGASYHRAVWWHRLGTDPAKDELLWGPDDLPDETAWPDVAMSRDGRWLLVHVGMGWSRTDVHLVDRATGGRRVVVEGVEAVSAFEVVGDRLYGTTTVGAPRGRVVTASTAAPDRWETLVPEGDGVIQGAAVAGDTLLVASTVVAVSRLDRVALAGGAPTPVELPAIGSVAGLDTDPERPLAFLGFESFARPASLYRWTPEDGVVAWGEAADGPEGDAYVVEQTAYPSTDDTDIPMFLLRKAGARPSADTALVLTGYGGFAVAMTPAWSPLGVAVAEAGGTYAVAGIRGGLEFGEDWHQAGMGRRKQQVFDDFHAAADWLVATGVTNRSRLAIRGGSNGGLLVGAAVTQRPDLCRAVHCAVPLLDMVRFPRFLIAKLWIAEYGDPDDAGDFAALHAYSPYHRVVDGTCYPAVLLTTAESDSRVDPSHALKFAARLQAATSCGDEHPVLLRVEDRAGHGQGKPVGKQADEAADVLAFLFDQLGVKVAPGG